MSLPILHGLHDWGCVWHSSLIIPWVPTQFLRGTVEKSFQAALWKLPTEGREDSAPYSWMIQSYPPVALLGSSQSAKQLQNKIETKYCIYRPITHTLFRLLSEIQTYGLHKFFCKWLYVEHRAKAMVIIKHWQRQQLLMQDQILSSVALFAQWQRADLQQQKTQCFGLCARALSELLWNQQGAHALLLNKSFKKCWSTCSTPSEARLCSTCRKAVKDSESLYKHKINSASTANLTETTEIKYCWRQV